MVSFANLSSPRGVLRLIGLLFSIIAFATMADVTGFGQESSFGYLVAANVLAFIWCFVIILIYIFQSEVDLICLYTPIIELVGDGLLVLLLIIAGCAAAVKCTESQPTQNGGTSTFCSYYPNIAASVAFTFLNFAVFIIASWFSYKLNVEEERKPEPGTTSAAA